MKKPNSKLVHLRFLPLLICFVVAVGIGAPLWIAVVASLAEAAANLVLASLWIGGPFLLAICLAFLVRGKPERILFDLSLVIITLVDLAALLLSVLPFVEAWDLFTFLPLLQFGSLTVLLVVVMLARRWIPELAKHSRSGTLEGT